MFIWLIVGSLVHCASALCAASVTGGAVRASTCIQSNSGETCAGSKAAFFSKADGPGFGYQFDVSRTGYGGGGSGGAGPPGTSVASFSFFGDGNTGTPFETTIRTFGSFGCNACPCDTLPANDCVATTSSARATCRGGYEIPTRSGGTVCIVFGSGEQLPLATSPDAIPAGLITITFNGQTETFAGGAYATTAQGHLTALFIGGTVNTAHSIGFLACGPLGFGPRQNKKRAITDVRLTTTGLGVFAPLGAAANGDPHLVGANGVKYDLKGVAGGVYSLFISPVVQVNMQLAEIGPEIRFMTKMAILYRGTELVVDPWFKNRADEITAHFNKLNATVEFQGWQMIVTFCDNHVISITSMHTVVGEALNFLDFTVNVPGCHDSYGGALGHTYQCAYVQNKQKFEWSTEREESFRLATLVTPSGTYSKDAECAHEDEFGRESLQGGMSF